ncbi:putative HTH domain antitoxin [Halarchaeum rubridurum]|uniref:UPF0175 family protein n=2 Tax=Halarchaeum TaxID=744724 RepID=A0AAV3S310_9EURY|nr:UPF0175 family protein [Halarchaeum rubridurum]MBP1955916.1 putative HTH domain antitoxin [Halarchaeum rubridurum]GGM75351.1 hypothetical protein GCM10009017_26630 [Halarchaeum rubridurum]
MIDVEDNIELLQQSGRFASEEEFLEEAFRALLEKRPELRVDLAVEQYKTGSVSLNRAAELAGYSPAEFKEILRDRGVSRDVAILTDEERSERLENL